MLNFVKRFFFNEQKAVFCVGDKEFYNCRNCFMDEECFSFKDNLLFPAGPIQSDFESFEHAFF